MRKTQPRTGLFDGDIFAYRPAAATTEVIDWEDGSDPVAAASATVEEACDLAKNSIDKVIERLKLDAAVVCLSCPSADVFRRDYWPTYKEARLTVIRPLHLAAVKQHLSHEFPTHQEPRLEADDILGILATAPSFERRVIVSADKDMQTIPGWWFSPLKHTKPIKVTPDHASRYHMLQTLTGDPVDGYPGAPGIGPKRAEKAMAGVATENLWDTVVETFRAALSKGREPPMDFMQANRIALDQARCAFILRHGYYDWKTKEVTAWHPTRSI